ncbi:MAG TPA: class I SAM-dependent methyltransferase [Gaiellaceae bacterium]|nr:class I SAM-dependent methyltransferase [Gaiellaceae bacterium]
MSDVHPVAAAGFGAAADVYERARPSYPEEAVRWIAERIHLDERSTVADVGAGTGKLTRMLVATHARIVAVEPVEAMRAVLLDRVPGIEVLDGTAEAIPLPDASADAITVAQAFHWFDHERAIPELHRVLKPGGWLVLIWNSRDMNDPLQRGIEDLLAPLRDVAPYQLGEEWREPLEASSLFGPPEEAWFSIAQEMTAAGVGERVASTSFVAAMAPDDRARLLERVRQLTAGREEPFAFPYVTEVYLARSNAST